MVHSTKQGCHSSPPCTYLSYTKNTILTRFRRVERGRTRGRKDTPSRFRSPKPNGNFNQHNHTTKGPVFLIQTRDLKKTDKPTRVFHNFIIPTTQVTLGVLEQAKASGVPALWIQPGAEDAAVIKYIEENGLQDKVIYGGPCILVEGDNIIQSLL